MDNQMENDMQAGVSKSKGCLGRDIRTNVGMYGFFLDLGIWDGTSKP